MIEYWVYEFRNDFSGRPEKKIGTYYREDDAIKAANKGEHPVVKKVRCDICLKIKKPNHRHGATCDCTYKNILIELKKPESERTYKYIHATCVECGKRLVTKDGYLSCPEHIAGDMEYQDGQVFLKHTHIYMKNRVLL